MAKALAESEGKKAKAEAIYIKYRVQSMYDEMTLAREITLDQTIASAGPKNINPIVTEPEEQEPKRPYKIPKKQPETIGQAILAGIYSIFKWLFILVGLYIVMIILVGIFSM